MRTHTHTFVRYFTLEDLEPIRDLYRALRDDFEHRAPHMSHDAAHAGIARLDVLDAAIGLLGEPVAEGLT